MLVQCCPGHSGEGAGAYLKCHRVASGEHPGQVPSLLPTYYYILALLTKLLCIYWLIGQVFRFYFVTKK